MINIDNCVGYVYDICEGDREDYSYRYHFKNTTSNITNFIYQNRNYKVIITDDLDRLIASSVPGGFLFQVPDQKYLVEELLPETQKLQFGDEEPTPLQFEYNNETGEYFEKINTSASN